MPGKSARWHARHRRDPYVIKARQAGFRARAAFKLDEIDRKYRLITPASLVVDLGAAPGSWCQYAATRLGDRGRIIAVDLCAMQSIDKVHFIRGDFTTAEVRAHLGEALAGRRADLVLSDLAPNLSGIADVDQARMVDLQQAVEVFCRDALRRGGILLTKLFAGASMAAVRDRLSDRFEHIRLLKPDASRAQSREIYLLGRGHRRADGCHRHAQ